MNKPNLDDEWISLDKAADICGVHRATIYRWAKDPRTQFPMPRRIGIRRCRVRRGDVRAWLAGRPLMVDEAA